MTDPTSTVSGLAGRGARPFTAPASRIMNGRAPRPANPDLRQGREEREPVLASVLASPRLGGSSPPRRHGCGRALRRRGSRTHLFRRRYRGMWSAMLRVVGLGLLALGAACGFAEEGLDPQAGVEPSQVAGPSTPSGGMVPGEGAAPSEQPIMRARKVEAKNLSVGVLFARKVHAREGTVMTAGPPLSPA